MDRLTDKRFVGDGFYQPKSHEERLEIFANVPKLQDIYNRLAEYERTGLSPEQIKQLRSRCIRAEAELDQYIAAGIGQAFSPD